MAAVVFRFSRRANLAARPQCCVPVFPALSRNLGIMHRVAGLGPNISGFPLSRERRWSLGKTVVEGMTVVTGNTVVTGKTVVTGMTVVMGKDGG